MEMQKLLENSLATWREMEGNLTSDCDSSLSSCSAENDDSELMEQLKCTLDLLQLRRDRMHAELDKLAVHI